MILRKYAAIDIGSNAIRLLISTYMHDPKVNKRPRTKKTSLVRVPLRLGFDVFDTEYISDTKRKKLVNSLIAFGHIIDAYEIDRVKACATSAIRCAENGEEIVQEIKEKSGIQIDIIHGETEAKYIAATDLKDYIEPDKNYLYVDVGGGSTEYTMYSNGKVIDSKSVKVGTVRHLLDGIEDSEWADLEQWIRKVTKPYSDVSLLGTGGNINYLHKMSGKKTSKPLSTEFIKKTYMRLLAMSFEERMILMGMKEDRADVVIPALEIFTKSLKWARSRRIYVPKTGLADGIINTMIQEDFGDMSK